MLLPFISGLIVKKYNVQNVYLSEPENDLYIHTELFVVFLRDIFPHNSDIGISITPALFMPKPECMSDFMNNCARVFTSIANSYILFSAFPPNRRPTPETKYRIVHEMGCE